MNAIKGIIVLFITLLMCMNVDRVRAQSFALRTNLLYDATLSPNIGAEVRVDSVWTVGINVGFNAWDIDKTKNKKWRHVLVSPNVRRYFGYKRDTLCVYGYSNGLYKVLRDSVVTRRMQYVEGNMALGGKYGYAWTLARDWRVEVEAGVAVGYAWFKENECDHCGTYYGKGDRIFLLPQLGVNVVYIIN